jgi:hypothetical protein
MKAAGLNKILLSAVALLGLALLTAELVRQTLNLALFYFLLSIVPLASMYLAAAAGKEAAQAQPKPGYKRLLILLASVAGAALVTSFAAWALAGFELWDSVPIGLLEYLPALLFLVLQAFTIGCAAKSILAGILLAAASLGAAAGPLFGIETFQERYFEVIPLGALCLLSAIAAFGGPLAALKLLSSGARRLKVLPLLVLPALLGLTGIMALHFRASRITEAAEFPYYSAYPADPYLLGDAMLIAKPYSGKLFLIDSAGKRAELARGSIFPALKYLLPELGEDEVMAARGDNGALWLLQFPSSTTARLLKGGIEGLKEQAAFSFQDGFPVFLEGGREACLARHINSEGDFFAAPPSDGQKVEWKKKRDRLQDCSSESKKRIKAWPVAQLKGEVLIYGGQRWQVPGVSKYLNNKTFQGLSLKNGPVFWVPAKGKNGYFTYFCRAGAGLQKVWPGYDYTARDFPPYGKPKIHTTLGGAVWWTARLVTNPATGETAARRRGVLVVNEEGTPLPPVSIPGALLSRAAGADETNLVLLRASGDTLWFNLDAKYMIKFSAADPGKYELWKFPEATERKKYFSCGGGSSEYARAVRAVSGGAMIAGLNGVYFMDWAGKKKKLY